jgi:hypothetical protein
VEALLAANAAAASYRPSAVATSVLHGQGIPGLLAAIECKVRRRFYGSSSDLGTAILLLPPRSCPCLCCAAAASAVAGCPHGTLTPKTSQSSFSGRCGLAMD